MDGYRETNNTLKSDIPKKKKRDPEGSRLGVIAISDFLTTRHPTACSYEWGKLLMISFNL
jgi:hypothetical protein